MESVITKESPTSTDKNGRTDVTTNVFVRMVKLDDTNVTTGKNIMFTEGVS